MKNSSFTFASKVISIGEIHGIDECTQFQIELVKRSLSNSKKVTLLLERNFEEQGLILDWLETQQIPKRLSERFKSNRTSAYLQNQFNFLNEISQLYSDHNNLNLHCIDMSFEENTRHNTSKAIRSITDEDEFDSRREEFIISKLKLLKESLSSSDHIFWIAGNMHTSKTSRYHSLSENSSEHIKTSGMWLDECFGSESIFSLPFTGNYTYQKGNKVVTSKINITSSDFTEVIRMPFSGLKRTSELNLPESFKESYDWIFGMLESTAPSSN